MIKFNKVYRSLERVGKGVFYGYLPKVGENGLAILPFRRSGDWQFSLPANLPPGEYWFQVIETNGEWQWSHGIVTHTGKITQIG